MYFNSIRCHVSYASYCVTINTGVFLGKMCSDRRKNHGCGQKKLEGTSSARFGLRTAAKCGELKHCADRVGSRTDNKNERSSGRAGGRAGGRTLTSRPKFLGSIGYQIYLAMVLRCEACLGLLPFRILCKLTGSCILQSTVGS